MKLKCLVIVLLVFSLKSYSQDYKFANYNYKERASFVANTEAKFYNEINTGNYERSIKPLTKFSDFVKKHVELSRKEFKNVDLKTKSIRKKELIDLLLRLHKADMEYINIDL